MMQTNASPFGASTSAWPEIGDIVPGHDGGRPDPVADLDGRILQLCAEDGGKTELAIQPGSMTMGGQTRACQIFRLREGIYFVDLAEAEGEAATASLLVDLPQARVLEINISVPDPHDSRSLLQRVEESGSQSAVCVSYRHYGIGGDAAQFTSTGALIGKHLRYIYSDSHVYDHIYLNERYYTWFCRKGPDQGLGDFEEIDFFEIRPDLTLLCWREKMLPCAAVMVEDHAAMRSLGDIFGVDSKTGKAKQTTVGAAMQLVFRDQSA